MNNGVREQAFKLRIKGYSYNEINKALGIQKSTLSGWFRDLVLSEFALNRLEKRKNSGSEILIRRNKKQTHDAIARAKEIQNLSAREINNLTKRELLLVGTALYWAEGYKRTKIRNGKEITSHPISFVNSDPEMVKMFIKFITDVLEIPQSKITLIMRLYPTINEVTARNYWMKETGLKHSNFRKTSYLISLSSKGARPFNRLPFGSIAIQVLDTKKFHSIMGFINGLKCAIN